MSALQQHRKLVSRKKGPYVCGSSIEPRLFDVQFFEDPNFRDFIHGYEFRQQNSSESLAFRGSFSHSCTRTVMALHYTHRRTPVRQTHSKSLGNDFNELTDT